MDNTEIINHCKAMQDTLIAKGHPKPFVEIRIAVTPWGPTYDIWVSTLDEKNRSIGRATSEHSFASFDVAMARLQKVVDGMPTRWLPDAAAAWFTVERDAA